MAVAQGPLRDGDKDTDKGSRGDGTPIQSPLEESLVSAVEMPAAATKCLFMPLRSLCTTSCRLEVERRFPQPQGTFSEEYLLDTDNIRERADKNIFKIDCEKEKCFTVCSII